MDYSKHIQVYLLIVFCVMQVFTDMCSNSTKVFTVEDNPVDVTGDVCLGEYTYNDCIQFTRSFNASDLPDPALQGMSVQRPNDFLAFQMMTPAPAVQGVVDYVPGLRFEWTSPISDISKSSMTGFFINVQSNQAQNITGCRILHIDHSKYMQKKLTFRMAMPRVSPNMASFQDKDHTYKAEIYSLPPPSNPQDRTNPENFKFVMVTTNKAYRLAAEKVQLAAHWRASITIQPNAVLKSIDVFFPLPDPKLNFGFTQYRVVLTKKKNVNDVFQETIFNVSLTSPEEIGHVTFDNDLSVSEVYAVVIQPINTHWEWDGGIDCLCYRLDKVLHFFTKICELSCSLSMSMYFDLYGNLGKDAGKFVSLPSTSKVSPNMSETTTTTTQSQNKTNVGSIVGTLRKQQDLPIILGVSAVAMMLIIVVIIFIYRNANHGTAANPSASMEYGVAPNSLPLPSLSRKTVYLLSSFDHNDHQELIKRFVDFLQTHCLCDVIEPSDFDSSQHQGGSASWLADKLTRCEFIIFLDSAGANKRLEAFCQEQQCQPLADSIENDLFDLGLISVYEKVHKSLRHQIILVSFSEELSKTRLFQTKEYILPKNMTQFLLRLHGLSSNAMSTHKSLLPLMPGCIPILAEGASLVKAVKNTKIYEEENPDWFDSHYRLAPTELQQTTSVPSGSSDSDYGSYHETGQRSVTPPPQGNDINYRKYDDVPSCITVETGSEFTADLDYSSSVGYSMSGNGHSDIKPPPTTFGLNKDGVSQALRNLNDDNACSRNIVPPPKKDELSEDKISVALRNLNQLSDKNARQHINMDVPAGSDILPPLKKSNLSSDKISEALRNLNVDSENKDFTKPKFLSQRDVIVPPPLSVFNRSGDGVSEALRELNHSTNTTTERDTIVPPTLSVLDHSGDGVSEALRELNHGTNTTISSNNSTVTGTLSTFPSWGTTSITQEEEEEERIKPPTDLRPGLEGADTLSMALRNINSDGNDLDFVSSTTRNGNSLVVRGNENDFVIFPENISIHL